MDYPVIDIEGTGAHIRDLIRESGHEEQKDRLYSYLIRAIREYSGMDRKVFCEWLGIPYRTLQEWEIGGRVMPPYVLRLIAYKVRMEKLAGNI